MAARSSPKGTPAEIMANPEFADRAISLGARSCRSRARRARGRRRGASSRSSARAATISKNVTAAIPLGLFTCVTGVSGGGKSTLSIDTLYKAVGAPVSTARSEQPGAARAHRRARAARQGDRHRPVADRPHAALQPRDLYRRLHADPRMVRRPARGQGARLSGRALLVQRQGRALRGLPGRRRHQDRDALPARRLRHLRRLQGQALRPRDAGGEVSRASPSPTCST